MIQRITTIKIVLIGVLFSAGFITPSKAQDVVQVDVLNVPSVLPSPFVSDFENDLTRGRYQVQLNYITTGTTPIELEFIVSLYRDGDLLIEEISRPEIFEPGVHNLAPAFDYIRLERDIDDVIGDLQQDLTEQVLQSGTIPEGDYRIEIDARPVDDQRIVVNEAIRRFSVTFPQSPRLTSPADEADITMPNPVFTWTPVMTQGNFMMEYDFLLVEVFDGQSPEDAIDANRAHHQQTLLGENTFVYTDDLYPLERGVEYAWQITAHDVNDELPIRNNGESEIYTFTYHDEEVGEADLADLEEIELLPDVLTLTGFQNVSEDQIRDTGTFYELNGQVEARLEVDFLQEPVYIQAQMRGLNIQKQNLDNPVVASGMVSLDAASASDALLNDSDKITLTELVYRHGGGVAGSAQYDHEEYGTYRAEGELNLTPSGVEGNLIASQEGLMTFESDLIDVVLNQIQIRLPDQTVRANGNVEFLGEPSTCTLNGVNLERSNTNVGWFCDDFEPVTFGGDQELLKIIPGETTGSIQLNPETRDVNYELSLSGETALNFEETDPCGSRFSAELSSTGDAAFNVLENTCTIPRPELNLGLVNLSVEQIDVDELGYEPESGEWNFDIPVEAAVHIPLFDEMEIDHQETFHITPDGVEIPQFTIDEPDLLPEFGYQDMMLALEFLEIENTIYPWDDIDPEETGPWSITFEGEASVDDAPGFPSCFNDITLGLQNGEVSEGEISADLQTEAISDCTVEIFGGHQIEIHEIGGSFSSLLDVVEERFTASGTDFNIETTYTPGYPLNCSEQAIAEEADMDLEFTGIGVAGSLEINNTGCELPVGPFQIELGETSLSFGISRSNERDLHINSTAFLHLSEEHSVEGNIGYDVPESAFTEMDFSIEDPFTWEVPVDDPVMTFEVDEASIDLDGFHVDGRQNVVIGDERVGVTFDQVTVDHEDQSISSGQIIFDEHFAFVVDFPGELDAPEFEMIPVAEEEDDRPEQGFYMELGAEVIMDSTGVQTEGEADGAIYVGDMEYDDLNLEFSEDFAFRFNPFGIESGRVDLNYGDSRIAFFDHNGLNPLVSGFAEELLPEKLPLPSTQVAFLRLRDANGDLLVDFEEPETGLIELSTIDGVPVELVMPVFDPADPPEIAGVEFENFTITATPGDFNVETGLASITLPDENPIDDHLEGLGIPFDLAEIKFGDTDWVSDGSSYLQLLGDLHLFDHSLSDEANTLLTFSGSGNLSGDIDLPDLDVDIPVVEDFEQMHLGISGVSGYLEAPVLSGDGLGFNFDIDADLQLGADTGSEILSELELNFQPGSITVSDFSGLEPENPVNIDLPGFDLDLKSITSLPVLDYSAEDGWDFLAELDADFSFDLDEGEPFSIPLDGLQLGTEGISIPEQDINSSTLGGLELPEYDLAGFTFKPLALRTGSDINFDWFEGQLPEISPELDFELHLPDLGDKELEPSDGFLFTDVSFDDGFLNGSMDPYNPIDGVTIPAGPSAWDPPELRIDEIFGELEAVEIDGEMTQNVNINLSGVLDDIPYFDIEEPDCQMDDVTFDLDLVGGQGFEGAVEDISPCGYLELGPITITPGTGNVYFSYIDDEQQAHFDGNLTAEAEGPEDDISADGQMEIDLIAGKITDGQISLNEPFLLPLPPTAGDPFMEFEVDEAVIDSTGLMLDAAGDLKAGDVDIETTFDQLVIGLPEMEVVSGQATISSGFGLQVGIMPLSASIVDDDADEAPASEALHISADSEVTLDQHGLNYDGTASAALRVGDQNFAELTAEFEDNFTFRVDAPQVDQGQVSIYTGDEPDENPLAILDANGFNFAGGIMAALPDTLGLPIEEIAYVEITDDDGEPVIDVQANDDGGYTLQTEDDPLPVNIPALADGEDTPSVEVHFDLTTDDTYVPNGGSISMTSDLDLEPYTQAPISLDSLGVGTDDGQLLSTVISVDLPYALGDHDATAETTIGTSGFEEAEIEIGQHLDSYDQDVEPMLAHQIMSSVNGGGDESELDLGLYGARISINSPVDIQISGRIQTTLIETDDEEAFPLFFAAGYADTGWSFDLETPADFPTASFGLAELDFDEEEPFSVTADEQEFIVGFSGVIDFEDMIGEPLSFSVDDFQLGATNLNQDPDLVLDVDGVTADLPNPEFELLDGSVTGTLNNPTIELSGRTLTASVESGDLTFFDEELEYNDLSADTDGNFTIGSISGDDVNIIDEYLVLTSLGVTRDDEEGLHLTSNFDFLVPDPVDQSGKIALEIGRDQNNQIDISTEIEDDGDEEGLADKPEFDLGANITVILSDFLFDLDPRNVEQTEVAIAADVTYDGEERINFGEAGSLAEKPGISLKPTRDPVVEYNVTGNVPFTIDESFLYIDIDAEVASSNSEVFEIVLNGQAGFDISGVSGESAFKGTTITTNGLEDVGNFDGNASFELMEIATLEVGMFVYEENTTIEVADGFGAGPEDLDDADEQTEQLDVKTFFCFGPCPEAGGDADDGPALGLSLGGQDNSSDGAFSGSIEQILFYETQNGDITFNVDNFEIGLGDMLEAHASLRYESTDDGMALMAAGSGTFEMEGMTAGAMIAGGFSTIGDELSVGAFAAVRADAGLEVVPGIIALGGFGGGFFYNPREQDLDMVIDAVKNFRPDAPDGIQRPSPQRPGGDDGVDIASSLMLYAELDIIGAGEANMFGGSTFMEITGSYFYMDADGYYMEMDGSAGMTAAGAFSIQAGRDPDNPEYISIHATVQVQKAMEPMYEAGTKDAGIEFMLTFTGEETVWGIAGGVEGELYEGMMNGTADLLASADGFLLEVAFWTDLDPPVITVEADVEGSVWYLTYDEAELPLGAYVIASGELSAGISVEADLKGAFVQRANDRYELFAAGKGCADLKVREGCLEGWFMLETDPVSVDGGLGEGDYGDLIAEAKQQRDEFEALVQEAMNNLEAEMEETPPLPSVELGDEFLAEAGYNFLTTSEFGRSLLHIAKIQNEEYAGNEIPAHLEDMDIYDDMIAFFDFIAGIFGQSVHYSEEDLEENSATSWTEAQGQAEDNMETIEDIADEIIDRLDESVIKAIEYESQASDAKDDMIDAMATSPVTHAVMPEGQMSEDNLPEFNIDENQAEQQAEAAEEVEEALDNLDDEIQAVVDSIEHNLGELDQIMGSGFALDDSEFEGDADGSINQISEFYAETLEHIDRYYSLKANKYWHRINTAGLTAKFISIDDNLESAVSTLSNRFEQAHSNRGSDSQTYYQERRMMAERVRMIEVFADDPLDFGSQYDFSGYDRAQTIYDNLGAPDITDVEDPEIDRYEINSVSDYEVYIRDLWINMHELGNEEYMRQKASYIISDFTGSYINYRNGLIDVMEVNTELIDDFYSLKNNMYNNLYHIVDNYLEIRGEIAGEDDETVAGFESKRQDILDGLQPPQISEITADANHESGHYFGKADIGWNATHPHGIAEVSIDIKDHEDDTDVGVGLDDYVSIGKPDNFTYTTFKEHYSLFDVMADDAFFNTTQVNAGIRVRSNSGVTSTQRVTFNLKVGDGGVSTTSDENLLPEDTSPPEQLYIHMEHNYEEGDYTEEYFMQTRHGGFQQVTQSEDVYWTSDREQIDIRAKVKEPETSILRYEYAVGSEQGGTDIVDWTELVGETEPQPDISGYWDEAIEGQTRILNMEPDEPYYVSVRAYNMNDQMIEVEEPTPVYYDDTPPEQPEFDGVTLTMTAMIMSDIEPEPFVESSPDYGLNIGEQWSKYNFPRSSPEINDLSWTESSDDQSGLSHYKYLVSTDEFYNEMDFAQNAKSTTDTEVDITVSGNNPNNWEFDFNDSVYVHIRAVNNAGGESETFTYEHGRPNDPNAPTKPLIKGYKGNDEIRVYLVERSYDAESGMKGHQYSVGTSPGDTDIQEWPDSDEIDIHEPGQLSDSHTAPYIEIDKDELPEGEDIYINMRGVNNQDNESAVASTGPVLIDNEPPEEPVISTSHGDGHSIDVDIENIYDPVSGVTDVDIILLTENGWPLSTWQEVRSSDYAVTFPISRSINLEIPDEDIAADETQVRVRVTNAAGLRTFLNEDGPPVYNVTITTF